MAHICFVDLPGGSRALVATLRQAGHRITLLTGNVNVYLSSRSFRNGVLSDLDELMLADPFDQTTIMARLKLIDEQHPLDLVYTMLDPNLLDVCVASAAMGKPALHWKKAAILRNKFAVRSALRGAGIPQPAFRAVSNWVELRAAVDDIGYPCVLKPVDAFGSVGVSFLRGQGDADEAGQLLSPRKITGSRHSSGNYILERFLDGPQISVETVFLNGSNHCYAIIDKRFNRPDVAAELGGTVCSPGDPRFAAAVDHTLRCLDALSYDFGFAHVEMILTADGPAIVEINPRMIGGVMSQVLEAALGMNPFMLLLHSLAGPPLDNLPRPVKAAGIFWITSPREGVLDTITLPPTTGAILRAETIVERGARVAPPITNNDRLGFVIVEAETDEVLLAAVAGARSHIDVRVV